MNLTEQVKEVLEAIDGGPWHWADFDLILIYMDDFGYDQKDHWALIEELNKQAYYHRIMVDKYPIGIWATREDITDDQIIQDIIEL